MPDAVVTTPVVTTEVGDLPFEMDRDVKVFRLTAHVFRQQIAPNKTIDVWGFNGSAPGTHPSGYPGRQGARHLSQ